MKPDLLEKFLALKDIKPKKLVDDEGDFEDYELSKNQIKQIKEAAEIFSIIEKTLNGMNYLVKDELGNHVGDNQYWCSSSFSC